MLLYVYSITFKPLLKTWNLLKKQWNKEHFKYQLLNTWNFYVLPKLNKSRKIIEEINKSNDICVNMEKIENLRDYLL